MGLFNHREIELAEENVVALARNLLDLAVATTVDSDSPAAVIRDMALNVCAANPAWTLSTHHIQRKVYKGTWSTPLSAITTPLELIGVVIDTELRAQIRLSEDDHTHLRSRAVARLKPQFEEYMLTVGMLTEEPESEQDDGEF